MAKHLAQSFNHNYQTCGLPGCPSDKGPFESALAGGAFYCQGASSGCSTGNAEEMWSILVGKCGYPNAIFGHLLSVDMYSRCEYCQVQGWCKCDVHWDPGQDKPSPAAEFAQPDVLIGFTVLHAQHLCFIVSMCRFLYGLPLKYRSKIDMPSGNFEITSLGMEQMKNHFGDTVSL